MARKAKEAESPSPAARAPPLPAGEQNQRCGAAAGYPAAAPQRHKNPLPALRGAGRGWGMLNMGWLVKWPRRWQFLHLAVIFTNFVFLPSFNTLHEQAPVLVSVVCNFADLEKYEIASRCGISWSDQRWCWLVYV